MKQIGLFLLLLIYSNYSNAQEKYNSENFKVTLDDIRGTSFSKDSTANAFVVYEQGSSHVDQGEYDLRTEVKRKIKILNKEGFNHANISILLYNSGDSREKIKDIVATTYNEVAGKVVKTKLLEKDIFREKYDENHTFVKFTLPNIKPGSIITYSYKQISPYMRKYHGWNFQSSIPKLYSEYRASIPGFWIYHIKLVGDKKLEINTAEVEKECLTTSRGAVASCGNSVYAMKDIPAFIEEDYMTTKNNYLSRIEYELETFNAPDGTTQHYTKTWKDVDKEFKTDKEIGKQLRKSIDLEDLLSSNIITEPDPLKKAKAIFKYVQENYTWNGDYKIYKDVSVKNLLKTKSGNVSSINILLHNILNEAGINAKPVLLSTRNNGFPTTIFPVYTDFNYLIVQVTINNKTYLLDATDNYLSFGEIPFRCLNDKGRLMDFKKGSEWINIDAPATSSTNYMANLAFDENQNIVGKLNAKSTGYSALRKRKSYFANPDNYLESLENRNPDIEVLDYQVKTQNKTEPNFSESYNIEYSADSAGDNIYLNPFFVKVFESNPFKLQERTYPIDFGYKQSYIYMLTLDIGDEYEVIEKPENKAFALPNKEGHITFSVNTLGNKLNILLRFNFKSSLYHSDYYPSIKQFYSSILDIQNNSLIHLKKK